ncbi:MAG: hypothetical protein QM811_02275 [Pirellulales bacterium]
MSRFDWRYSGVVLLLIGMFMWVTTSQRFGLMNELKNKGLKTRAKVVSGNERKSNHRVRLAYDVKGGKSKSTEIKVSGDFYEKTGVGAEYDILYLPEDPQQIMIVGEPLATDTEYNIAVGLTLAGALLTGLVGYSLYKSGGD